MRRPFGSSVQLRRPRSATTPRLLGLVLAAVVIAAGVWHAVGKNESSTAGPAAVAHAPGGVVRVVVSSPPELSDQAMGGDTLRSLVFPKLFIAQPDGTYRTSLVKPGSDRTSRDKLSATFALRPGATWSDGSPITAADLDRSKDARFVSSVTAKGKTITVHFTHPLDGWRRLWSGSDSVTPPSSDLYGGPFVIASVTSGLETKLVRNPSWNGGSGGPFLDEVDLVIAADATMGRQLLATGGVDVYAPIADTARTPQLQALSGVSVSSNARTGAWVALRANPNKVTDVPRNRTMAAFPRAMFVNGLLHGEAALADGFASDDDRTWAAGASEERSTYSPLTMQLSTPSEQPLAALLQRSLQAAIAPDGGTLTYRSGDQAATASWLRSNDYQWLLDVQQDGPDRCWTCAWGGVDADLARRADGGDQGAAKALEEKARRMALVLPLWKPTAVVGFRSDAVQGVVANGYVGSPAWNAETWWKPEANGGVETR